MLRPRNQSNNVMQNESVRQVYSNRSDSHRDEDMEEGEIRLTPDVALSTPKEKRIRKKQHAELSGGTVNSAQHDNAADRSTISIAKDMSSITMC